MAFKRAKEIVRGDRVHDRGRAFVVNIIQLFVREKQIIFIDVNGKRWGPYTAQELLDVDEPPQAAGWRVPTHRFAELLKTAGAWDKLYRPMHHAQEDFLLNSFVISDSYCVHHNAGDLRRFDIPRVIRGKLFTRCE